MSEMNDRELLELAAKAYADESVISSMRGFERIVGYSDAMCCHVMTEWNPLTDDGDALPLAVELNMSIEIDAFNGDTLVIVNDAVGSPLIIINQRHLGNPCKATRRAIVRAAAEIGRQM